MQQDNKINFMSNTRKTHKIGACALRGEIKRHFSKEDLKNLVGSENFKKYEPLFDYIDKYDNKKEIADGHIDLACFAHFELVSKEEAENISFIGGMFNFNKTARKLSKVTKTSLNDIQNFLTSLVEMCKKQTGRTFEANKVAVTDSNRNVKTYNNGNFKTIVTSYDTGDKTVEEYDDNKLIEKKEFNAQGNITSKIKYTYNKDNQLSKYTEYDNDNNPISKTIIYRFETEEEAKKFANDNIDAPEMEGVGIHSENKIYIVEITKSIE